MFSYICKNCGKTEQFGHYPLATIKLIEKYSDGVIENVEELNISLKTYYNSYGRFIPLLGELDKFSDCNIEEYRFIEKDKLRYVYRWKLPKFFLCKVICGRCELVEFLYDALPIEMNFMQENKSKIMSVDEEQKMLNQLKELLRKRNLDDDLKLLLSFYFRILLI